MVQGGGEAIPDLYSMVEIGALPSTLLPATTLGAGRTGPPVARNDFSLDFDGPARPSVGREQAGSAESQVGVMTFSSNR